MKPDGELMWSFETARVRVTATIHEDTLGFEPCDDEEARAIEDGRLVVFGTVVTVYLDGNEVGSDSLWGSVYAKPSEFFDEHIRYASARREALSRGVNCGSYFPDMVREAIANARARIRMMQGLHLRSAA